MWYEVTLEPDNHGTLWVTAPAFPEVATFGRTRDEAMEHARDAIEEAIVGRVAEGEPIPAPAKRIAAGRDFVDLLPAYQGYHASVDFDAMDRIFVGRLVGTNDIVSFHADSVEKLTAAFHEGGGRLCRGLA